MFQQTHNSLKNDAICLPDTSHRHFISTVPLGPLDTVGPNLEIGSEMKVEILIW